MLLSRRARELSLSVVLFAVPVVLLYGGIGRPSQLNVLDRAVLRTSGVLQRVEHGVVAGIGDLWDRYIALWNLDDPNAGLRRQNAELRENNEILSYWAIKGRRLEKQLGFRVTPELRSFKAEVVARGVSPFYRVLKIRVRHGPPPRPGQSVAVPAGLLGRVLRVSGPYADVLLLSDAHTRIKVTVKRTASRGELRGTNVGNLLSGRIEYLSPRDTVHVGDELLTSGMGGRYPRHLVVGRITRVKRRIRGRYQVVEVEPAVAPAAVRTVYVITTRRPVAADRRPPQGQRKQ